jgi:hypothetical protein
LLNHLKNAASGTVPHDAGWLAVMDGSKDDAERELIARRREHCLNMAADIPPDGRRAETRRLYKARQRYNEGY